MAPETVLETERLALTNWLPEHLDELLALHGDAQVARYLTLSGTPWTRQQAEERLALWARNFAERRMGKLRLVRKTDGVMLGRAGFGIYPPTDEPEIGFALFPDHWGHGYAHEAASGLRDWIFRETDAPHFIGFADTRNTRSLKVLRTIGMTPTHVETEPGGLLCQYHVMRREDLA